MDFVSVGDTTKLQLHIYTLGYYPMGECILVIVIDKSTDTIYQSILIDCFEQGDVNKITPILDIYKLKQRKLDFIVWTHPDYDHSIGLGKIISNYLSKNTVFLLPDGFFSKIFSFKRLSSFASWIAVLTNKYRAKMHNVEYVNVSNRRSAPPVYGSTRFSDGYRDPIEFGIEILTPFAGHVFSKLEGNKKHKANDISLSLMIRFGNQNFYFGGDSENMAIRMIQSERLEDVVFIKIPHHASKSSTQLPNILNKLKTDGKMDAAISVSTSFEEGNADLPEDSVLEKYKRISSRILITEDDTHTNNYGIWKCVYTIRPQSVEIPVPEGDASVWYKKRGVV